MVYNPPPDKVLFGQYLVEQKKITPDILKRALQIQEKEGGSARLRESHRLLGQILLEDFHVFKNRVELNRYIVEFNEYKEYVQEKYFELYEPSKQKHNPK
jgi:hypothetical protein